MDVHQSPILLVCLTFIGCSLHIPRRICPRTSMSLLHSSYASQFHGHASVFLFMCQIFSYSMFSVTALEFWTCQLVLLGFESGYDIYMSPLVGLYNAISFVVTLFSVAYPSSQPTWTLINPLNLLFNRQ